ncbi:MAG: hypothetical protein EAS52_01695 [Parapedobacter sp.]|nr:MAG: hypothetical protein EAS52_01695 [Parapedobacter sp.]
MTASSPIKSKFNMMKNIVIICTVLLALGMGCSKEKKENEDTGEFTFRVKKNGKDWKVNGAQGHLNREDGTFYVQASGENNELISFNFRRNPLSTGRLAEFNADAVVPACELCAAIAASYSLDPAKDNRFEILGFDNLESRILGKFSVNLKKNRLHDGEFTEESNVYEGTFNVVYKESAW